MRAARAAVAGLAAAVLGAAAAPAQAGTYTAHLCRTPDGAAASTALAFSAFSTSTSSWSGSACPGGGVKLALKAGAGHVKDDVTHLRFSAPADTLIVRYRLWRAVRLGKDAGYHFSGLERRGTAEQAMGPACDSAPGGCTALGSTSDPDAAANLFDRKPPGPVTGFGFFLSCGYWKDDDPDCPAATPAAELTLFRAEVELADDSAPAFEVAPAGGLVDPTRVVAGRQAVSVLATDRGGGVASVVLEVDGREVASTRGTAAGPSCAPPYPSAVPCPLRTSAALELDTAALPDGAHQVRVVLVDAAGNRTASGATTITTANAAAPAPACQPTPGAATGLRISAKLHRTSRSRGGSRIVVPLGRRPTLRGTLRDAAGRPVAGAEVCIAGRAPGADGLASALRRVRTDGKGAFRLRLPSGASRDVWAIHDTPAGPVVGVRGRIDVRPAVSLSRTGRKGRTVRLRGRVRGAPLPAGGLLVELQARRGKRWQTFRTARTGRDGRVRLSARFASRARHRVRLRVPAQGAYPYAAGTSGSLTVRG